MTTPVTLEDIYQIFERSQAEADRRFAEADRRAAEADRRLNDLEDLFAESKLEFDRRMEVMRQEIQTDIQAMRKMVGGLSSRWGSFVENLVESSALAVFEAKGKHFTSVYRGLRGRQGDFQMEVDVLVANDTEAVVIEVKSHLTQEEVDDFLARLPRFKNVLPFYRDHRVYGAVAGIEIDQGVDRYAYRQGLYVLRQAGEFVEVANDDRFQPTPW